MNHCPRTVKGIKLVPSLKIPFDVGVMHDTAACVKPSNVLRSVARLRHHIHHTLRLACSPQFLAQPTWMAQTRSVELCHMDQSLRFSEVLASCPEKCTHLNSEPMHLQGHGIIRAMHLARECIQGRKFVEL